MNIDIKSVLIGVLLTTSIMLVMGFDSKSIEDHTHDADEIKYREYGYAGYGTLKSKIQDMEDDMDDFVEEMIVNYAKRRHTHY